MRLIEIASVNYWSIIGCRKRQRWDKYFREILWWGHQLILDETRGTRTQNHVVSTMESRICIRQGFLLCNVCAVIQRSLEFRSWINAKVSARLLACCFLGLNYLHAYATTLTGGTCLSPLSYDFLGSMTNVSLHPIDFTIARISETQLPIRTDTTCARSIANWVLNPLTSNGSSANHMCDFCRHIISWHT